MQNYRNSTKCKSYVQHVVHVIMNCCKVVWLADSFHSRPDVKTLCQKNSVLMLKTSFSVLWNLQALWYKRAIFYPDTRKVCTIVHYSFSWKCTAMSGGNLSVSSWATHYHVVWWCWQLLSVTVFQSASCTDMKKVLTESLGYIHNEEPQVGTSLLCFKFLIILLAILFKFTYTVLCSKLFLLSIYCKHSHNIKVFNSRGLCTSKSS